MNAYARNHFTELPPCRCGREPMRVYYPRLDRYAVKCTCGNKTRGFTTIAGAGHSWTAMNKKEPPPVCKTGDGMSKNYTPTLSGRK